MDQHRRAETEAALRDNLEAFLGRADSHDMHDLEHFLAAVPERASPSSLLPIDEMEERLQLISRLEVYWRKNFARLTQRPQDEWEPFKNHAIAALVTMNLADLRLTLRLTWMSDGILNGLCKIPALTKIRE